MSGAFGSGASAVIIAAEPGNVSARFAGPEGAADLAVLIVSYQSAADLPALLDSLRAEAARWRMRVVVADNASTDGSADIARAAGDVVVVETGGNLGYAAGLNAAMSHVGESPAILVLNPDLVLEPGCIAALERRMRVSGAGIVVPRILDAVGALTVSLRREPGVIRALADALIGSRWLSRPRVAVRVRPLEARLRLAAPDRLGDRRSHARRPLGVGCGRAMGRAVLPLFGGDRLLPAGTSRGVRRLVRAGSDRAASRGRLRLLGRTRRPPPG